MQYLTVEQAFERDKLSKETGEKVLHKVYHFGLMEFSPEYADRGQLDNWIQWANQEEIARRKQEKKAALEKKTKSKAQKPKKKPARHLYERDALEGSDEPFGLFNDD